VAMNEWLECLCPALCILSVSVGWGCGAVPFHGRPHRRLFKFLALMFLLLVSAGLWAFLSCFVHLSIAGDLTLLAILTGIFVARRIFLFRMTLLYYVLFSGSMILGACILLLSTESGALLSGMTCVFLTVIFFLCESGQRFIRQTYEERAVEYQNKIVIRQVSEVQNIYMNMRGWRHDYHNHLQALKAYLGTGNSAQAQIYLTNLENDLNQVHQLIETGNVSLDAILNSKLSLAIQENIEVDYKVAVPQKLTVRDLDLCVLIGNLIDNGVESCQKMESGKKYIHFYMGVLKKQLYIYVSNATGEYVRRLDDAYITTKRGNHGHGLKRINGIVDKYDGYINRQNEPGVFVTEIMLPL